ncbi:MAG TPA: GNAT family N-acetyltransferase [Polyangium sp.]|nr:GNAT family N-acetyltransferase [Polyangium sp.]
MNCTFRDYTPADRPGCLEVFDSNIPEFFSDEEREYFLEFLDRLPGRYGVIVDAHGRIVGCGGIAASRTDPQGADLTWGMIHRALHRQGIGRLLTGARLSWVDEMPSTKVVYLNTSHLTEAFYEKFGFRTVKRIPNGYRLGLHQCDMERTRPVPTP